MDYHSARDLDPEKPLSTSAVAMFQRFRQTSDEEWLTSQWNSEVARHLRLCELTILYYAQCRFYWCELPLHPVAQVNNHAFRQLEDAGFKVEHQTSAEHEDVPEKSDPSKRVSALVVRSVWTASWRDVSGISEQLSAEWRRREALEDEDLALHPPRPKSTVKDGAIASSEAAWASVLDGKYIVEVQPLHHRAFLLLFDLGGKCLHREATNLSFGALFGPDVGDVADWQDRAIRIADQIQQGGAATP